MALVIPHFRKPPIVVRCCKWISRHWASYSLRETAFQFQVMEMCSNGGAMHKFMDVWRHLQIRHKQVFLHQQHLTLQPVGQRLYDLSKHVDHFIYLVIHRRATTQRQQMAAIRLYLARTKQSTWKRHFQMLGFQ